MSKNLAKSIVFILLTFLSLYIYFSFRDYQKCKIDYDIEEIVCRITMTDPNATLKEKEWAEFMLDFLEKHPCKWPFSFP